MMSDDRKVILPPAMTEEDKAADAELPLIRCSQCLHLRLDVKEINVGWGLILPCCEECRIYM